MPFFRILVRGENFRMNVSGSVGTFGFYTTRFVEVENPETVENEAVAAIRTDPELTCAVLNNRDNPPRIFIEEIEQIPQSDIPDVAQGFTFFVTE